MCKQISKKNKKTLFKAKLQISTVELVHTKIHLEYLCHYMSLYAFYKSRPSAEQSLED